MYDVVYRLFSQDVHTHPRLIEKYMVFREDGEVGQIGWGAGVGKDISTELIEAAKILLHAMDAIDHLFELQIKEEIKLFGKSYKKLYDKKTTKIANLPLPPAESQSRRYLKARPASASRCHRAIMRSA